ncbi:hypothetical protein N658DRAFT_44882 [Parathielavia hyrcaniae]|uniref:Uncharacterized protein n=1 Tax=Parathielavia hyrcaniae TaxID=113614 RepID=A0AAN6Q4D1_9PEZI|nr:hypothetical protein N658DRAFT_44882 [Parathielavia hyrcaniae]
MRGISRTINGRMRSSRLREGQVASCRSMLRTGTASRGRERRVRLCAVSHCRIAPGEDRGGCPPHTVPLEGWRPIGREGVDRWLLALPSLASAEVPGSRVGDGNSWDVRSCRGHDRKRSGTEGGGATVSFATRGKRSIFLSKFPLSSRVRTTRYFTKIASAKRHLAI